PGDEVIVPAYTFIATASSVVMIGALPVFVDIEPGTFNLDPQQIEPAITERTKAIVPVHIAGRPADMDGIMEVAERHGLKVVEDACQAHGAEWRGQKVGTIGDAGAFSHQASKHINAGEGGTIVTNDEEVYLRCYSLVNLGRIPEGEWYQHEYLGSNYRMTNFQAAILRVQLSRWEEQAKRREENAAYLNSLLREVDGISTMDEDKRITRQAWHAFKFRYHPEHFGGVPKTRFCQAMAAEGVPCGGWYQPLYRSGLFRRFSAYLASKGYFGARKIDYTAISLPVVENVCENEDVGFSQRVLLGTRKDLEDIAAAILKVRKYCDEL
ncbi:MAG TPA: DegT/DnrJ/EryC1/StrS family aminotransferase, partial [Armatimonadetes bacterium]|nr:DegT/DnrJ/EryC1/StrS family aminotransferase [Armatimonadota bacterium]